MGASSTFHALTTSKIIISNTSASDKKGHAHKRKQKDYMSIQQETTEDNDDRKEH